MTIAAVSAATDNTTIALGDSSETPMAESPNANSSISIQSDNTSSVSEDDEKLSSENSGKLLVSDDETKEIFYDNKYYLFRGDCWTINNNFESSASITSDTVNDLTITGVFRTQSDCVGLYWNSQDIINHPYISYGNRSNYTDVVLEFDYKMTGCMDFSNTVITIEANTGETYYLSMNRFVKNNHLKLDFNKLTLIAGKHIHKQERQADNSIERNQPECGKPEVHHVFNSTFKFHRQLQPVYHNEKHKLHMPDIQHHRHQRRNMQRATTAGTPPIQTMRRL